MTGAGLLKRFGSKERHTWCICAESSPAWTPQLRPGTTIGHKTARLTPSQCVQAYGLPAKGNVCRRGRWKGGKVSRTVTTLLSVLQKWTWAFPISIKLATVLGDAPHPVRAFKIKASTEKTSANSFRRKKHRWDEDFVNHHMPWWSVLLLLLLI